VVGVESGMDIGVGKVLIRLPRKSCWGSGWLKTYLRRLTVIMIKRVEYGREEAYRYPRLLWPFMSRFQINHANYYIPQSSESSHPSLISTSSNMGKILRPPRRPISLWRQKKYGPEALIDEIPARGKIQDYWRAESQGVSNDSEDFETHFEPWRIL
jgi:hypothetical protein